MDKQIALEEQKREAELNNRKNIYKRISLSEIRNHARIHDNTLDNNLSLLRRKRVEESRSMNSFMNQKETIPKSLSSKYLKNVIEEERKNRLIYQMKENEAREKREKANRFS